MLRTIGCCEKNIAPVPAAPIVIPAGGIVDIIPNNLNSMDEFAYISFQNTGNNDCYYAFGQDASVAAHHGRLSSLMAVPVPAPCRVSVYSAAGTTIAVTIFKRVGGL